MSKENKEISLPPSPSHKRAANITNTDTDLTICDPPSESSTESETIQLSNSKSLTSNERYELKVKSIKHYISKELKRMDKNRESYYLSQNLQKEIENLSISRGCPIHAKMIRIGLIV